MVKQKLTITELALEDRPREKMLSQGIRALSTAELIAILIGSGNRNETAVELSQRILNSADNDLNRLGKYSVSDFVSLFYGIGEAKAISIIAALELGRRRKEEGSSEDRPRVVCSNDIFRIFYPLLVDLPYEEFWILLLNAQNRVINKLRVSQGGVAATYVDVRLILKPAIEQLASGIVLCAGEYRGGCGIWREYMVTCDGIAVNCFGDRQRFSPWGMEGGKDGLPGAFFHISAATGQVTQLSAKTTGYPLQKGDIIRVFTPGAGGVGDPKNRPAERVLQDVMEGKVSPEGALRDYGVNIKEENGAYTIVGRT